MHEQQLQELRREKWRLNGRPIRTLEEAREFIDSVGFCLLYPQRPAVLAPTFVGAYAGSDEHLPARQMAFADPSACQAKDLMGRLLREHAALDRASDELWAKLRITRVDYTQEKGVFWDVLFRWSPEAVKEGMHVSVAEALTALVSKYLDCVLAAQQEEVEHFFSNLIGRARVREAISALQTARELSFVHVAGRVLLQVSSLELPAVHPVERKFKLQPRFVPQPPRPGKPLVQRRPRKSASPSTPVRPAK